MPGQKVALKWWSSTSLFLSTAGENSFRRSNSSGTWVGSLEVGTSPLVD